MVYAMTFSVSRLRRLVTSRSSAITATLENVRKRHARTEYDEPRGEW